MTFGVAVPLDHANPKMQSLGCPSLSQMWSSTTVLTLCVSSPTSSNQSEAGSNGPSLQYLSGIQPHNASHHNFAPKLYRSTCL